MTENEKNSPVNHTATSCASSTDSGVIIIDNTTAIHNGRNETTTSIPTTKISATDKPPFRTAEATDDGYNDDTTKTNNTGNKNNATKIDISNYINFTKKIPGNGNETLCNGHAYKNNDRTSSILSSKNVSPTVSIRSTSISIVSIDENAADSSIVDSDSDFENDAEGVHSKYIVKKLGQQTTYPANSPDIPNISKGLTVLSQQILPNGCSPREVTPFANNILNGNLGPSMSTAPKISSVAVSNSTDVTFGDRHYYTGPVTMQQFLIDGRSGQDNPSFDGDIKQSASTGLNDSQKINIPHQQPYKFISNRKAIILTSVIIVLTILIGILIAAFNTFLKPNTSPSKILGDGDDSRKNIPINSTIDPTVPPLNGTLQVLQRDEWKGHAAKMELDKLQLPVHRAIISHTATETCLDRTICSERVRIIQEYHMDSFEWDDVGYNFLIGGDGNVYEGRGWDKQGAHTKGFNTDSVGISFVGTFTKIKPTEPQLEAAQLLLAEGVRLKKLVPDYRLYGARQFQTTESPGRDSIGAGKILRIVPRDSWLAQPPSSKPVVLKLPVSRVVVIPTQTEDCITQAACTFRVRYIQTFNIESTQYDDIIYNFLIGGDGNVYEGRGWDREGAHLKGYNDYSISLAFIGTFKRQTQQPNAKQMNVSKLLLEEGVKLGKLTQDYKIIAANLVDPSSSSTSADALYASFKNWPHWSEQL